MRFELVKNSKTVLFTVHRDKMIIIIIFFTDFGDPL